MFQRILVPLDGSARAEQAFPIAERIARATGGSLTLLRVVETPKRSDERTVGSPENPGELLSRDRQGLSAAYPGEKRPGRNRCHNRDTCWQSRTADTAMCRRAS